jgi:hypothetical protein
LLYAAAVPLPSLVPVSVVELVMPAASGDRPVSHPHGLVGLQGQERQSVGAVFRSHPPSLLQALLDERRPDFRIARSRLGIQRDNLVLPEALVATKVAEVDRVQTDPAASLRVNADASDADGLATAL